jgi:hypothetical protein
MSTKKAVDPLLRRGLTAFRILGRLPDVYQFYFFTLKVSGLTDLLLSFATFQSRVRGVTRRWQGRNVEKPRNFWIKRRKLFQKG